MSKKLTLRNHGDTKPWILEAGETGTDEKHLVLRHGDSKYLVVNESGSIYPAAATNSGTVHVAKNTVAYTDTTAKNLFVIPANADIVGITVDVTTAFNAGTTNVLDIGKTGTDTHFKNDLAVGSTGQTVTGWSNLGDVGTSNITVNATYAGTGAAATAGQATVYFFYTMA